MDICKLTIEQNGIIKKCFSNWCKHKFLNRISCIIEKSGAQNINNFNEFQTTALNVGRNGTYIVTVLMFILNDWLNKVLWIHSKVSPNLLTACSFSKDECSSMGSCSLLGPSIKSLWFYETNVYDVNLVYIWEQHESNGGTLSENVVYGHFQNTHVALW